MKNFQNRKKQMSLRVAVITLLSAFLCVAGLFKLRFNTQAISKSYLSVIDEDYANVRCMHQISHLMWEHQMLVFSHLLAEDPESRPRLEESASEIEGRIREQLASFGESMKNSEYESYYHEIYGGLIGYFKNVEVILSFSRKGETATASYYMNSSLKEYISGVDDSMDRLDQILEGDMEAARNMIEERTRANNRESVAILAVMIAAAAASVILCTRISEDAAGTDLLTGMANVDRFKKYGEGLEKNGRIGQYSGVAVSIRNFRFINQEYGSKAGDSVLQQFAGILTAALSPGEIAARNGADNYILLIKKDNVRDFLGKLKNVEVVLPGVEEKHRLDSRCGIYDARDDDTVSSIVEASVMALAEARKNNMADQMWFLQDMQGKILERREVLNRYTAALNKEDFQVYYQPKVDMRSNTLCGSEALVRWIRDGKVVPPMDFIPILEEEGRIVQLDYYVLEHVCRDIKGWLDAGMKPVKTSSNFSKLHLRDEGFADKVLNIIKRYGVDGKYIEVELTESSGYEDPEALESFVARMKSEGISISIDDFGTGYSSLSMLKDVDADVVKLDRSFLTGLESSNDLTSRLIANVVQMIKDLNRSVICEGVETREQVDFLKGVGCFIGQGFLYDRPLPKKDYEERLKSPVYGTVA